MNRKDRSNDGRWRNIVIALAAGIVLIIALVPAIGSITSSRPIRTSSPTFQPTSSGAQRPSKNPKLDRGLYSGAINDADGNLDVSRTIARTVAVHADTYYYLIWDRHPRITPSPAIPKSTISQDLWKKLPGFADAAGRHGISVVVYMVPPSETNQADYLPYGWNYQAWFGAIGEVAAHHHSIVGIAMDDLAGNFTLSPVATDSKFTAEQLSEMRTSAQSKAPWIRFYALLYGQDIIGVTRILPYIRSEIDGIIYAFAGPEQLFHKPQNTTDPVGLVSTTERVRNVSNCGGAPQCWQGTFDRPSRTATVETLAAQSKIESATHARRVSILFADDRSSADGAPYGITLSLDGKVLPVKRTTVDVSGAHVLSATIPATPTSGTQRLELKISKPATSPTMTIFINSISLNDGINSGDLNNRPDSPWKFTASEGSSWSTVRPLQLIDMYYCARFGIEGSIQGAADAAYLKRLMPQLRYVRENQIVDGIVAYRLNLTGTRSSTLDGDPDNFPLVARLYR